MALGLAPAAAQALLDTLTGLFAKLHIGDPGVAGATSPAAGSTIRVAVSMAATTAGGVKAMNGTPPSWTNGSATETLSHLSLWDAVTVGNFKWSVALAPTVPWVSTNTFNLTVLSLTITPLAA